MMISTSPILVSLPEQDAVVCMVRCGGSHTAALTNNNELYTWGSGKHGATGLGKCDVNEPRKPFQVKVIDFDCSKRNTLVVTEHGHVFGCGDNRFNQLGR
jgi:alpha-tubulin suppressor-like RCC1 family protein